MPKIKRYTYNEYQKITRETSGCDDLPILAMGLLGETIEFMDVVENLYDLENSNSMFTTLDLITREAGDIMWYAARIMDVLGVPFRMWQSYGKIDNFNDSCIGSFRKTFRVCKNAAIVSEHIKKAVGHGHALDLSVVCHGISNVIKDIAYILKKIHGPWQPDRESGFAIALRTNVEKLRKRYPNGFETEKSVNREG